MKKRNFILVTMLGALFSASPAFAGNCDPGFQKDYAVSTPGFDPAAFASENKDKVSDSKGTTQFCFLGASASGMSPKKVWDDMCGCKEEIKKNCSIKKGKIKAKNGVLAPWCEPFRPFL